MDLNTLNEQQRKAVKIFGGPILIFAGAGSGKTRVLTHKIAYLIEEMGMDSENILAVTFTNKAADEMKQRVQELLKMDVSSMNVGTFHSISARILRKEIHHLGFSNDFIIYDQDDSKSVIKKIIRDFKLDEKTFVPKSIQAQISNSKNNMFSSDYMLSVADGFVEEKVSEIYKQYEFELNQSNALDFDDLLIMPLKLFNEFPNRLEYYQDKFKYVLVDEYQDTNRPQFEFVQALSSRHRDICVVGDDDQSIYSWRGADVNNILNFSDIFQESHVIKLEQNYRSTKTILECAWSVVSNNVSRAEKKLWTDNKEGDKLTLLECNDERDESWKILNLIKNETSNNSVSFNDIVVLYRTNAQSRSVEDVLRREGVPYQIIGGTKFYSRKEVKDVLAYLRIILNPSDSVSFDRIINFPPRGIGKTTLEKIHEKATIDESNYLDALMDLKALSIGAKQKAAIANFVQLIIKYQTSYKNESIGSIVKDLILDIDLASYYENQNTQDAIDRWHNVQELINSIVEFEERNQENTLRNFLEEVSLLTDIDKWNESDQAITLMTIHSAKGLEFPVVTIVGLEEGLFPLGNQLYDNDELEEERRLFYVAMTRAENKVYLTYAKSRRRFGGPPTPSVQSRFINELPFDYVINLEQNYKNVNKSHFDTSYKNRSYNEDVDDYLKGDIVEHKLFGRGKIIAVEGSGPNSKLTIIFSGNIRKKIIAKYASLKQLN